MREPPGVPPPVSPRSPLSPAPGTAGREDLRAPLPPRAQPAPQVPAPAGAGTAGSALSFSWSPPWGARPRRLGSPMAPHGPAGAPVLRGAPGEHL